MPYSEATRKSVGSPAPSAATLRRLLSERFGYAQFRLHQEEVCQAVAAGEHALVVMPTGSGKSLCYQLPGIARGGTTLVVSPLIALMEDQTAKLRAMGFAAQRIHSGLSRDDARAVCRDYLSGDLDFLTIAPERLSVAGFPDLLARRPPVLVAIDEAHCISHWGHDFRPDYRLLRDRLAPLAPVPILALTATATVRVQDDILEQLGMPGARRFIRGFRRSNLAVEALDRPPSIRPEQVLRLLAAPERRPAIVYVPTRRAADDVAQSLSRICRAGAYHAGMPAPNRSAVQDSFLAGALDVVVATIAFGMGVDKPDVRTVVHMALPGTIEGYYQEIGRAGRDGLPARALLFYSWGDRRVHETFFQRDYPDVTVLDQLRACVPAGGLAREDLIANCKIAPEAAEPALDKLWIHGGLIVDSSDRVFPGRAGWHSSYLAIRGHRASQLDEILDFASSASECRMVRLVRHFGDTHDRTPCGVCDVCDAGSCVGRRFRPPTNREAEQLKRILDELGRWDGQAIGTLLRSVGAGLERAPFERLLDALERAGLVHIGEDTFEKDGQTIRFRRVHRTPGETDREVLLSDDDARPQAPKKKRPSPKRSARAGSATAPPAPVRVEPTPAMRPKRKAKEAAAGPDPDPMADLFARLRAWRLKTSKAHRIPAFRVMADRVLTAIVESRPMSLDELLQVPGMGPKLVKKYGQAILQEIGVSSPPD